MTRSSSENSSSSSSSLSSPAKGVFGRVTLSVLETMTRESIIRQMLTTVTPTSFYDQCLYVLNPYLKREVASSAIVQANGEAHGTTLPQDLFIALQQVFQELVTQNPALVSSLYSEYNNNNTSSDIVTSTAKKPNHRRGDSMVLLTLIPDTKQLYSFIATLVHSLSAKQESRNLCIQLRKAHVDDQAAAFPENIQELCNVFEAVSSYHTISMSTLIQLKLQDGKDLDNVQEDCESFVATVIRYASKKVKTASEWFLLLENLYTISSFLPIVRMSFVLQQFLLVCLMGDGAAMNVAQACFEFSMGVDGNAEDDIAISIGGSKNAGLLVSKYGLSKEEVVNASVEAVRELVNSSSALSSTSLSKAEDIISFLPMTNSLVEAEAMLLRACHKLHQLQYVAMPLKIRLSSPVTILQDLCDQDLLNTTDKRKVTDILHLLGMKEEDERELEALKALSQYSLKKQDIHIAIKHCNELVNRANDDTCWEIVLDVVKAGIEADEHEEVLEICNTLVTFCPEDMVWEASNTNHRLHQSGASNSFDEDTKWKLGGIGELGLFPSLAMVPLQLMKSSSVASTLQSVSSILHRGATSITSSVSQLLSIGSLSIQQRAAIAMLEFQSDLLHGWPTYLSSIEFIPTRLDQSEAVKRWDSDVRDNEGVNATTLKNGESENGSKDDADIVVDVKALDSCGKQPTLGQQLDPVVAVVESLFHLQVFLSAKGYCLQEDNEDAVWDEDENEDVEKETMKGEETRIRNQEGEGKDDLLLACASAMVACDQSRVDTLLLLSILLAVDDEKAVCLWLEREAKESFDFQRIYISLRFVQQQETPEAKSRIPQRVLLSSPEEAIRFASGIISDHSSTNNVLRAMWLSGEEKEKRLTTFQKLVDVEEHVDRTRFVNDERYRELCIFGMAKTKLPMKIEKMLKLASVFEISIEGVCLAHLHFVFSHATSREDDIIIGMDVIVSSLTSSQASFPTNLQFVWTKGRFSSLLSCETFFKLCMQCEENSTSQVFDKPASNFLRAVKYFQDESIDVDFKKLLDPSTTKDVVVSILTKDTYENFSDLLPSVTNISQQDIKVLYAVSIFKSVSLPPLLMGVIENPWLRHWESILLILKGVSALDYEKFLKLTMDDSWPLPYTLLCLKTTLKNARKALSNKNNREENIAAIARMHEHYKDVSAATHQHIATRMMDLGKSYVQLHNAVETDDDLYALSVRVLACTGDLELSKQLIVHDDVRNLADVVSDSVCVLIAMLCPVGSDSIGVVVKNSMKTTQFDLKKEDAIAKLTNLLLRVNAAKNQVTTIDILPEWWEQAMSDLDEFLLGKDADAIETINELNGRLQLTKLAINEHVSNFRGSHEKENEDDDDDAGEDEEEVKESCNVTIIRLKRKRGQLSVWQYLFKEFGVKPSECNAQDIVSVVSFLVPRVANEGDGLKLLQVPIVLQVWYDAFKEVGVLESEQRLITLVSQGWEMLMKLSLVEAPLGNMFMLLCGFRAKYSYPSIHHATVENVFNAAEVRLPYHGVVWLLSNGRVQMAGSVLKGISSNVVISDEDKLVLAYVVCKLNLLPQVVDVPHLYDQVKEVIAYHVKQSSLAIVPEIDAQFSINLTILEMQLKAAGKEGFADDLHRACIKKDMASSFASNVMSFFS
eukprot:m.110261 g.110261  ORF g.110261 m.110261 type:complete len:1635 (-) comp9219_c0_seq8:140-5044(-)